MDIKFIKPVITMGICKAFYRSMVQYEVRKLLGFQTVNWDDAQDGYLMCMEDLFGVPDDGEWDYAEKHGLLPRHIIDDIIGERIAERLDDWSEFEGVQILKMVEEINDIVDEYVMSNYLLVRESMNYL